MRVCVCVCDLKQKLGKNKLATIANIDAGKSDAGKKKGKNSESKKRQNRTVSAMMNQQQKTTKKVDERQRQFAIYNCKK